MTDKREIYAHLVRLLRERGAVHIRVFGSFVRGEERPDSDIDVIVTFSGRKSLLDLARIEREVSEAIGRKVDLLTEGDISPFLIDRINGEAEVIYG
jgi:predicted nucleotidyltransferase